MLHLHKIFPTLLITLVVMLAFSMTQPTNAVSPTVRIVFRSVGAQDGYIWESAEDSGLGFKVNSTDTILRVGDDNQDRQYRVILSFDTAKLPDTAIVTRARVWVQQADPWNVGWPDYGFSIFEVRVPYFGNSADLRPNDFQAPPSAKITGIGIHVNEYETKLFGPDELQYINLQGYTQIRFRQSVDDNDNMSADYRRFYSGDASISNTRPKLVIYYYLP